MIRLPDNLPAAMVAAMTNLVTQLNAAIGRLETPPAPTRLFVFEQTDPADLPDPSRHANGLARFDGRLIHSDGTAWLNADGSNV